MPASFLRLQKSEEKGAGADLLWSTRDRDFVEGPDDQLKKFLVSWRLLFVVPRRSSPVIEVIFPRNQVKTKKKGLRRNLPPFSSGNFQDLLVLARYFSSGHPALNSRWEDA